MELPTKNRNEIVQGAGDYKALAGGGPAMFWPESVNHAAKAARKDTFYDPFMLVDRSIPIDSRARKGLRGAQARFWGLKAPQRGKGSQVRGSLIWRPIGAGKGNGCLMTRVWQNIALPFSRIPNKS
jgi:hypothetical protein